MSYVKVSKEAIDLMENCLADKIIPAIPSVMKTHHVVYHNEELWYRMLACTCKPHCKCYGGQMWHFQQEHKVDKIIGIIEPSTIKENDWVTVVYDDRWYLGRVCTLRNHGTIGLMFMKEVQDNK